MKRIVRLTEVSYDLLKKFAEMVDLPIQQALTHAITVAYCFELNKKNQEDND